MKVKLKMILMLFVAFGMVFAGGGQSFAQEKTISGTISDDSGALLGVSIIIKGTSTGTEADFNGKYSIKAKVGDVLSFSYIGYVTVERTVGTSNTINVIMEEDDNVLDEVVVTGVAGGTSRKKLSVTVNRVGEEQLQKVPATSAETALQGKVAGIKVTQFGRPGQGATVILRGAKNLFGSQEPLVIMDGVLLEGGLSNVNVNDIKSYEIVKGASASALYGSRAGNGVIVVTTKRGKGKKMEVTVRGEVGFSAIRKKIELNKSHQYDLASDWKKFEHKYTKYDGVTYPSDYEGGRSSEIIGARVTSEDGYADNRYGVYYDAQDQFFRNGLNTTFYTSVANGTEKSNLFFAFENTTNKGVLVETDGFNRENFRFNGDLKINDWLKLSTSNLFIKTLDNTPGGGNGVFFNVVLTEADVNLAADNPDGQPYNYLPNHWESNVTNPLYPLYKQERERRIQRFLGGYKLNLKFSDALNFDAEYSFENRNNRFTLYNPYDAYTTSGGNPIYSKGFLLKDSQFNLSQKIQATLNFSNSIGEDLNVKAKVSYLIEDDNYEFFGTSGTDFLYKDLPTLNNFETKDIVSRSEIKKTRAKNVFAIASLDYKDRYIFDGMIRYDGSSLFGKNEKWHPYYRVSGAWRISEDFKIDGIQEMKIHAAYGTAGQRPGYDWQYEKTDIFNGQLSSDRVKGNPDLKPSRTNELEIGLNANFLGKFTIEAVYSNSKTEDQFMLVDIFSPANRGKNRQWQNVGNINFNTLEVTLGINDVIKTDNFKWDLNFIFDTTSNEITGLDVAERKVGYGDLFLIKEGEEFGSMYGRKFVTDLTQMEAQLPNGKDISEYSVNVDGVVVETTNIGKTTEKPIILTKDKVAVVEKIGNQTADFKIGLFSSMQYKGFSLSLLWDYSHGGDVYNRQNQWLTRDYRHISVDQYKKTDKKAVDYYQGLYDVNQNNAYWVEDATYLKLREASLYYSVNKKTLNKMAKGFFTDLRLGITGRNLITFTDYSGWDPEVLSYNSETLQYFAHDLNVYPNTRTYTFSIQLKF